MNRFRTKKKAKDGGDISARPSIESDTPGVPPLKSSMTFRRGKKKEPEPKLELDVANALPSSDDFRTSLLMNGLSARFSMLREQDDPTSKLGKASDDSVLFSNRQPHLNNFGFQSNGLSDIAEVSSIRSAIRPPFLSGERTNSYHSVEGGYGTDDGGSIMSRAKPGEGNNLFGGRQKIYKIPMSGSTSMKNLNGEYKMGGRALYDDDVSQSAFQKMREREKEQERERLRQDEEEHDAAAHSMSIRPNSPPLSGYNRNRETSSTTSSAGPSLTRSSTAATSITSQFNGYSTPTTPAIPNQSSSVALDRSITKGKRLYETGLDQHLHNQQSSALNRLESLSKPRNTGARTPSPSLGSPTFEGTRPNAFETHQHPSRSASPPPTASKANTFDFGTKAAASLEPQKSFVAPPLSPPVSEGDDQSTFTIKPNDRGKATALGAFAKPVQPYDEKKYAQRQLQMQQGRDGRETPPMRKHSPPRTFIPGSSASARPRADSNSTYSSARSASSSSAQSQFEARNRNLNPHFSKKETPGPENRLVSAGTFLASPTSSFLIPAEEDEVILPTVVMPDSVDVNREGGGVAKQITPMQDRWAQIRRNAAEKEREKQLALSSKPLQLSNETFTAPQTTIERPPESQHPANRLHKQRLVADYTDSQDQPAIPASEIRVDGDDRPTKIEPPADSPTLGPGLSGLVRQHLRSDSNESSMFGGPSPAIGSDYPPNPKLDTDTMYSTTGNPWEYDNWDHGFYAESNGADREESHEPVNYNGQFSSSSTSPSRKAEPPMDNERESRKPSWEREMELHHTRAGSSETQKERDDFKTELATRRKRVQENLKSFAEADDRSTAHAPGMLKTKISRESFLNKPATGNQSKAMKMLGLGNSTISSAPSPNAQVFDENLWQQEEEEMLRGVAKPPRVPPQTKAFRQARRDAQRDREREVRMRHQQRAIADSGDSDGSVSLAADRQRRQQRQRTPSEEEKPESSFEHRALSQESKSSVPQGSLSGSRSPSRNARDRSSSDASGRSKSRNGRYRDDLAKAMAEGHGNSGQGVYEDLSARRGQGPTRSPAPNAMAFQNQSGFTSSPAISGTERSRSNSRSGYFDNHQLQPIQTHIMDIGISPRPSPITPFSVNSTPALTQPSPSASGGNTPSGQGFPAHSGIPTNRKRSVNKSDISEPTLFHKTSDITTVNLPPGASLQNGNQSSAPPLPPMDPRRRQTRTQTMFGAITGKNSAGAPPTPPTVNVNYSDELSTFSADEADKKSKPRQKLRKSSSEGGNLNARTRQAFEAQPSPALPGAFPTRNSPPAAPIEGGMF